MRQNKPIQLALGRTVKNFHLLAYLQVMPIDLGAYIFFTSAPFARWQLIAMRSHFCRAMLCKRGLCRHAVSVCPSVCHVREFCENESSCPPSGSQTILVFPQQTSRQYSDGIGTLNAGGVVQIEIMDE